MSFKKLLSLVLVLCMVLSFFPVSAFANNEVTEEVVEEAAEETEEVVEETTASQEDAAEKESEPDWDAVIEESASEPARAAGDSVMVTFLPGVEGMTGSYTIPATYVETVDGVEYFAVTEDESTAAKGADAFERKGYVVDSWNPDVTVPFARPTGDTLTATAVWEYAPFAVSYQFVIDGDDVDAKDLPEDIAPPKNELVNIDDTPDVLADEGDEPVLVIDYYTFNGFDVVIGEAAAVHKDSIDDVRLIPITDDTTITLSWTIDTHDVVFDYTGANDDQIPETAVDGKDTRKVAHGDFIDEDAYVAVPENDNRPADFYDFEWAPKGEYDLKSAVVANEEFTATWTPRVFEVYFMDALGKGIELTEEVEYLGTAVGFDPEPIEGKAFLGWGTEEGVPDSIINLGEKPIDSTDNPLWYAPTDEEDPGTALYQIYDVAMMKVTFNLNGGEEQTAGDYKAQKVEYGTTYEESEIAGIPDPVKFGYTFKGWTVTVEGKEIDVDDEFLFEEDTQLNAKWAEDAFVLFISDEGAGAADEVKIPIGEAFYGDDEEALDFNVPVDGIEAYSPDANKFTVEELTAKGFTFDAYQYVTEDEETHEDVTVPVPVGELTLVPTMPFVKADAQDLDYDGDGSIWSLTLTPVVEQTFYVVDFETEYGTAPESQTFVTYPEDEHPDEYYVIEPELKETTILEDTYYLDGWYVAPPQPTQEPETKWVFADEENPTEVNDHVTLVAVWLPLLDVKFTLREEGAEWATGGTDPVTKQIPEGKTFAGMYALAEEEDNDLVPEDYEFPEATRPNYGAVTWLNGDDKFGENDEVNEALTLTDDWEATVVTITYVPGDGSTYTDKLTEDVYYGSTVSEKTAPTMDGKVFEGWICKNAKEQDVVFEFNSTKVDDKLDLGEDGDALTLTAKWGEAAAYVQNDEGKTSYYTLEDAVAAAEDEDTVGLYKNVELTADLAVANNVTFDFGNYKVTCGDNTVTAESKLTIKKGTFNGGVFAGTIDLVGGTFLGTSFAGAELSTFGGKYNANAARPINAEQLAEEESMLAVVTSDGYYTLTEKQILTYDFDQEGVEDIEVWIGVGETPKHALTEHAAVFVGFEIETITAPTAPEGVSQKFVDWKNGNTPFDPESEEPYEDGDATIVATWTDAYTVEFVINGAVDDDFTEHVIKNNTAIEPNVNAVEEIINEGNTGILDKLECWEDESGKAFDFTTPVTENLVLTARVNAKIVFDYNGFENDHPIVVVYADHGDRLSDYEADIPAAPDGSEGWFDGDRRGINITDDITGDMWYYAVNANNDAWTVVEATPLTGYQGTEANVVRFTGSYDVDAFNPIVMSAEDLTLTIKVEAPKNVKESDSYQIQINNGSWLDIMPIGTLGASATWDGKTINNNLYILVNLPMTLDQIKTAVDAGDDLEFEFAFKAKDVEADEDDIFTVEFDPNNLKLTDYDNELEEFVIRDGEYKWSLTLDPNNGENAVVIGPVEYGERIELPSETPVKEDMEFSAWVGKNVYEDIDYEFSKDESGAWQPEGYVVMTDDVTLTAKYDEIHVRVTIINGNSESSDSNYKLTSSINAIPLPMEDVVEDSVFTGWKYFDDSGNLDIYKYHSEDTIGSIATFDEEEGWTLTIVAQYGPENRYVTFHMPEELQLDEIVKDEELRYIYDETGYEKIVDPEQVILAEDFYDEDVAAAEEMIPGFQYWTLTAPNENGYDEAPDRIEPDYVVTTDLDVYAYTKGFTVLFQNDGELVGDPQGFMEGDTVGEIVIPEDPEGVGFKGWALGDATEVYDFDAHDEDPIEDDMTFNALWFETYTVMFFDEKGDPIGEEQIMVEGDTVGMIEVPEPDLVGFKGWTLEGEAGLYDFDEHAEDVIVDDMAFHMVCGFDVTFNYGEQPETRTYDVGSKVKDIVKPDDPEGQFKGWALGDATEVYDFDAHDNDDITADMVFNPLWSYNDIQWRAGGMDLQGKIKMRLKFAISDDMIEKPYSVKIGDFGTIPFSDAEYDGELYWFLTSVSIPYYYTKATVQVLDENGNPVQFLDKEGNVVESFEYSIETYVNNMSQKTTGTQKQLIDALGVYGQAAAYRFMSGPAVAVPAVNWSTVEDTVKPDVLPAGVTKIARSADFQSDNSLLVRVYLEEGKKMSDYTWTLPDGATKEQIGQMVQVRVPNIAAPRLDQRYEVSVSDGTTTATTVASILSYAKSMAGKDTNPTGTNELMAAMYYYWAAAQARWPNA